jgi:hypothetical protein
MTSIDVYPLTRAITLSRTERVTLSKTNLGRAIGQSTYQSRLLLARGMPDCPFSATSSGSLPASGGYGPSANAQLHRHATVRGIQGGWRRPEGQRREETSSR